MATMAYPQIAFTDTHIDQDCLIGRRRKVVVEHTLRYQLDTLKSTGRYDAFKLKWHPIYDDPPEVEPVPKHLFWDSDVAKWIEGACYFLAQYSLPDVDAAVHELVDMIAEAQQADGYLNIHYMVVAPGKRWSNLKDMHELYNAGHLIEAALAHEKLYKNGKLLNVMLRYVDLISKTFGPNDDQLHGYPGHPEIELSLLRLYDHTQDPKHLAIARYFLTERGNNTGMEGEHYYDWEAKKRGDDPKFMPSYYPTTRSFWYHQAHEPIVSQETIEGHSVRAGYLYTAYTDLAFIEKDSPTSTRLVAMHRLWRNMVDRKMYITGGIGAIRQWEGFGVDFFLPQSLDEGGCYSETCASISVMMWAQRLLQIELDGPIADVMELCLYNSVLTSMSHDGKAFTYHNQLASSENDLDKRSSWFTVACCPPNIMRLLGHIGGYVWSQHGQEGGSAVVAAHLFVSSSLDVSSEAGKTTITQKTEWPWKDQVDFKIDGPAPVTLKVRIPGWAGQYELEPKCSDAVVKNGYLTLPSAWLASNKAFSLKVPLKTRWVAPPTQTGQDIVALARGPVIYCVEDFDNAWVEDHFKTTVVDTQAAVQEHTVTEKSTGEQWVALTLTDGCKITAINAEKGLPFADVANSHGKSEAEKAIASLNFTPYGLRSNRGGKGHMRVGLRMYSPGSATK